MHYPKMLDRVDDDIARSVLDTLQAAAEAQALPGFDGNPRGMGAVEMWRRQRFGEAEVVEELEVSGIMEK